MRVFWSPLGCSWSTRRIVSLLACVLASPAAVARACDTQSLMGASSQYMHTRYHHRSSRTGGHLLGPVRAVGVAVHDGEQQMLVAETSACLPPDITSFGGLHCFRLAYKRLLQPVPHLLCDGC